MNKQRRKALTELMDRITKLESDRDEIKDALETLRDEEEESFENMPESLQQGDTGQAMEEAIDALGEAINSLEDMDFLSTNDYIEQARN